MITVDTVFNRAIIITDDGDAFTIGVFEDETYVAHAYYNTLSSFERSDLAEIRSRVRAGTCDVYYTVARISGSGWPTSAIAYKDMKPNHAAVLLPSPLHPQLGGENMLAMLMRFAGTERNIYSGKSTMSMASDWRTARIPVVGEIEYDLGDFDIITGPVGKFYARLLPVGADRVPVEDIGTLSQVQALFAFAEDIRTAGSAIGDDPATTEASWADRRFTLAIDDGSGNDIDVVFEQRDLSVDNPQTTGSELTGLTSALFHFSFISGHDDADFLFTRFVQKFRAGRPTIGSDDETTDQQSRIGEENQQITVHRLRSPSERTAIVWIGEHPHIVSDFGGYALGSGIGMARERRHMYGSGTVGFPYIVGVDADYDAIHLRGHTSAIYLKFLRPYEYFEFDDNIRPITIHNRENQSVKLVDWNDEEFLQMQFKERLEFNIMRGLEQEGELVIIDLKRSVFQDSLASLAGQWSVSDMPRITRAGSYHERVLPFSNNFSSPAHRGRPSVTFGTGSGPSLGFETSSAWGSRFTGDSGAPKYAFRLDHSARAEMNVRMTLQVDDGSSDTIGDHELAVMSVIEGVAGGNTNNPVEVRATDVGPISGSSDVKIYDVTFRWGSLPAMSGTGKPIWYYFALIINDNVLSNHVDNIDIQNLNLEMEFQPQIVLEDDGQ